MLCQIIHRSNTLFFVRVFLPDDPISIRIQIYIYTYSHIHVHVHTCVLIRIRGPIHIHIYIYIYTYTYIHIHIHIHIHLHVHIHITDMDMDIYIYYMAEPAIRSVRKMTHADWLPSCAISFLYNRVVLAGKFPSWFEEKQLQKEVERSSFVWSVRESIYPRGFFVQTERRRSEVCTKTSGKYFPVETSHSVNK